MPQFAKRIDCYVVAERYGVSNKTLWQYLALAIAYPGGLSIPSAKFTRYQQELCEVESAITAADKQLNIISLLDEASFAIEDYLALDNPLNIECGLFQSGSSIPCSEKTFGMIYTDNGRCLVFQPSQLDAFNQTVPGPKGSLSLPLHAHNEESSGKSFC